MHLSHFHLKTLTQGSGWSLLELVIVLALMAAVAALARPQLFSSWQGQFLYDERQRLAQQVRFARLTSLQQNAKVSLCWSKECGSSVGFLIYLDTNNDGYWQSIETPLSRWQIKKSLTFSFNRGSQISFNKAGNTAQSGTMILCLAKAFDSASHQTKSGYALVLSSSGRLREARAPCI